MEFTNPAVENLADGTMVNHIPGMGFCALFQAEGPRFDTAHKVLTGGIQGRQEHIDDILFAIAGGHVKIEQVFLDVVIIGRDPIMFFDDIAAHRGINDLVGNRVFRAC